jgi:ribosomal protein S18 acetylase RimI-like enzyme
MALLVPPADTPALRNAIVRMVDDPSLMARLGVNARAIYESFYTEDRMLDAYRQTYIDLLRAKCPLAMLPATPVEHSHIAASRWMERVEWPMVMSHPATEDHRHTQIIREATASDLSGIVTIHQKAFSNFFLTQLGSDFLQKYYTLVLNYHSGIMLVSEGRQSAVEGFACGFVDPGRFYQRMWGTRLEFVLPVFTALLRQPSLIANVIDAIQRIYSPTAEGHERSCELSSIAVAPEVSGNGFGKSLIRAFVAHAQSMNAHYVYLTTDAEGNDAANAFYRDAGFQHTRRFLRHKGRWMNEYVISSLGGTNDWQTY